MCIYKEKVRNLGQKKENQEAMLSVNTDKSIRLMQESGLCLALPCRRLWSSYLYFSVLLDNAKDTLVYKKDPRSSVNSFPCFGEFTKYSHGKNY